MKKVYILVEVSYDYYRFQDNIYATSSKKELDKYIKEKWLEVLNYESGSEEGILLNNREECHIWLEEF